MQGLYRVFWSPEGRAIAEVEATSPRNAIRKAPMPYRKYLGEMYATAVNPNAWVAVITLHSDGFLLGGTRKHVSSPFATEKQARDFAWQSVQVNKGLPDKANADIRWNVIGVYAKNPIDTRSNAETHNIDLAYARACGGTCADCGATPDECEAKPCKYR